MPATPQLAAIVEDSSSKTSAKRIVQVLDLLGISWQVFKSIPDLAQASMDEITGGRYAVVAPLDSFESVKPSLTAAHSFFLYGTENAAGCSKILRALPGCAGADLVSLRNEKVEINVSDSFPAFTGPMHELRLAAAALPGSYAIRLDQTNSVSRIIDSSLGAHFVKIELEGLPCYINCSGEFPNLDAPLKERFYDVKEHFLSVVPLLMYLKWAFQDSCWQANEAGACLIIDDPVLKSRYGFLDFQELDALMQTLGFSTNIAFIPWNCNRTTTETAALIRKSDGRYSLSVHGCDHTAGEFASSDVPALHRRTALAKRRMERHREKTAVSHDLIMIFPQGVFSRKSMEVLPQHEFLAVVNTEVFPASDNETLSLKDAWGLAILKYGSFPLFTRRYPWHGFENFAFDLLLGKPCLIVEHHQFFKKSGQDVTSFIGTLNSMNCKLRWRTLGDVIRRSYQWRMSEQGAIQVKMFAGELLLSNQSHEELSYHVEKADHDSAGIKEIRANGNRIEWKTHDNVVSFTFKLAPGTETLIEVRYHPSTAPIREIDSFKSKTKIALRRYASEFRDNFLSRHKGAMLVANRARKLWYAR